MRLRDRTIRAAVLTVLCAGCTASEPAVLVLVMRAPPAPSADPDPAELDPADFGAAKLTPRERREWSTQLRELRAPCPGVDASLAACAADARSCPACVAAARMLFTQVRAGTSRSERAEALHARFDLARIKTVAVDGVPSRGPKDAVVTVVVWSDFECPFCRMVSPTLDALVRRFPGKVRLVEHVYPLQAHMHADAAARAARAADGQGKYWEMRDLLYANQEHLEQSDLERYATSLELDVARFRRDAASPETTARIANDRKLADDLGLDGTPFLFVNGRPVDLARLTDLHDLEAWVELDIQLAEASKRP